MVQVRNTARCRVEQCKGPRNTVSPQWKVQLRVAMLCGLACVHLHAGMRALSGIAVLVRGECHGRMKQCNDRLQVAMYMVQFTYKVSKAPVLLSFTFPVA